MKRLHDKEAAACLLVEKRGHVTIATLNRPERHNKAVARLIPARA